MFYYLYILLIKKYVPVLYKRYYYNKYQFMLLMFISDQQHGLCRGGGGLDLDRRGNIPLLAKKMKGIGIRPCI